VLGRVRVKKVFKISKIGMVAGCDVVSGKAVRGDKARILRDGVIIADSRIGSLRRFKEDVKEVTQGYECGITVDNWKDVREGDILEVYAVREIKKLL